MTSEMRYQLACELIANQQPEQAVQAFEALLQMPDLPSNPAGFFLDLANFLSDFDPIQTPQWRNHLADQARLKLAHLYWDLAQKDKAFQTLAPFLESQNPLFYRLKARWLIDGGELDLAIEVLNQVLVIVPADLSAYEDLAMIANLQKHSERVLEIIQAVLPLPLSPRLLEELLWAAAYSKEIALRPLFLELCIQHIHIDTYPSLVQLLQALYQKEDWEHAAFLGWHLWQHYRDSEIMNILVLSCLKQSKPRLALEALLSAPESFFKAGHHWYKLGIAYRSWQMPFFASHAYRQALQLSPELHQEIADQGLTLAPDQDASNEIMKAVLIDPAWAQKLGLDPVQTLAELQIPMQPALNQLIKSLPLVAAQESELKFPDLASETS